MLDLTRLLQVPRVDAAFDISPDKDRLAFAWNKTGEWQIYEMGLDAPDDSKPVTAGAGGKFNPRYSPDGRRLAYVLDTDGSESYHLVVYDPATGVHTDLTPGVSYALQPNFCWSPDGRQLAFLSDQNGHFCSYTISSSGGEAKLILDTGHPAWQVEWSRDGRHLAVCCETHGQDYGIFIVDLETTDVIELNLNAHAPKWSPDGRKLAFHTDLHGWFDIGIYELASEEIVWITKCEGDSQLPVFQSNLTKKDSLFQLAYTQNKGAFNWIETFNDQGERKIDQIGKGIHSGIRFTSDLKRMVFTFSSPSQPPDLWMIDVEQGTSIQLTESLPEDLSNEEFMMPEEIHYMGMDGVEIPALLFRPKDTPAPAVVIVHGGPNWHYSAEWDPVIAHFASRGYAILAPNYRGSTGYGRDWQYAARFDLGGVDTRDVAAGAQYLIREGIADPKRIAVTGRSHGGYLTMTCLTRFPELWCGGSAVVPFMNWFKSHEDSRPDLQHWNIENMGAPDENYERWYHASPYFFLDRVKAPVQLICGGYDPRCPASDSLEARDKLVELGKHVQLLLYQEEGHHFLNMENVLDSESRRVEFLAKVLE